LVRQLEAEFPDMKPGTTLKTQLASKANRNTDIATSTMPDRKASVIAAVRYSGVPEAAIWPTAAAVISDTTATGPTASARLVPNSA
jgi:hypothetical protein